MDACNCLVMIERVKVWRDNLRNADDVVRARAGGMRKRWRRRARRSQSTTTLWQRCRGVPTSSFALLASAEENWRNITMPCRAQNELSDRNAAVRVAIGDHNVTSTLAVARDVGRAALTALRTEPATVSRRPERRWLAPVLRSLGFRGKDPSARQDPP